MRGRRRRRKRAVEQEERWGFARWTFWFVWFGFWFGLLVMLRLIDSGGREEGSGLGLVLLNGLRGSVP